MAENEQVKVDVIVVGGGPAGLSAAHVMAQNGLDVIVVERGEYAGSKNVSGLLYSSVLNELIPGFYEKAPVERPVSKRAIGFLDDHNHSLLSFGSDQWSNPPYNNTFVVYRSQFDRWYAKQVEEVGGSILDGMVVDALIYEGDGLSKKVVGVKVRGDEDFYADVVILADGATCLVTESAIQELGLRSPKREQSYAIGVKEIIALSREKIEDRFNIEGDEGVALDFIGSPFKGLTGGGFIYTGKETLAVGFAAKVESMTAAKLSPNDIIDVFKKHPNIKKYLDGGEIVEYAAHLIPEGGYNSISPLTGNGLMIVGDAAGLVNMAPLAHQGSNLAMASGKFAGEVAVAAKQKGNFSRQVLYDYEKKLAGSFVMRDLKKYRDAADILDEIPELLSLYPRKVCNLLTDYFSVTLESKSEIQKQSLRNLLQGLSKFKAIRNLVHARKLL